MTIHSFEQIDKLCEHGMNICKGCRYESAASCTDDRLPVCDAQYREHSKAAFLRSSHTSEEYRAYYNKR